MPDLLISIVVPTYNYASLLPRALDSVLSQLDSDSELIVIDDGSCDDTPAVLANYTTNHPTLKSIRQLNAGPGAARNNGIRRAAGRYVLLLDADDELLPGALLELHQIIKAHPDAGIILGAQISVYPDGREKTRPATPVPALGAKKLIERYLLQKRISISHCCSLFRRDLLLNRPYPENIRSGEDIAVFAYLLVSAPVCLTEKPLAKIYKHSDSLRHNQKDAERMAKIMINEIFATLPIECQTLRRRYEAQRYLSLFRAASLTANNQEAWRCYRQAFTLSPLQALRWSYLRKALRLRLQRLV